MKTNTGKKPSNKRPTGSQRTKGKNAGADSGKTRPQVAPTQARKAASGKQNNSSR
jgi:hypothetical protein